MDQNGEENTFQLNITDIDFDMSDTDISANTTSIVVYRSVQRQESDVSTIFIFDEAYNIVSLQIINRIYPDQSIDCW